MLKAQAIASVLAGLLLSLPVLAATPVHKCVVKGTVTYQRDPCLSGRAHQTPTPEQLNADRKKQNEAAVPAIGSQSTSGVQRATSPSSGSASPNNPTTDRSSSTTAPVEPAARYRCDGRTYCSQMTSCAEAKYFLANCPGVKMDGDRNGIPCEKQWCNK